MEQLITNKKIEKMKSTTVKTEVKVISGISYSGTEMIKVVRRDCSIGETTFFIKLDSKRRVISISNVYDSFCKIGYDYNLAGTDTGFLVDEIVKELEKYNSSVIVISRAYQKYYDARLLQDFKIQNNYGNVYDYPLYEMVEELKSNRVILSLLKKNIELNFNSNKLKKEVDAKNETIKEYEEVIRFASILKAPTVKGKVIELAKNKAKEADRKKKLADKKEADYLKAFYKKFGKDKSPVTVTRNVWSKGSRGHFNLKGVESFRGCVISTTAKTTTIETLEGEIITTKD